MRLFEEHVQHPLTKEMLREIRRIITQADTNRRNGSMSPLEAQAWKESEIGDLKARYWVSARKRSEACKAQLDDLGRKYNKGRDPSRDLLALRRAELKYKSMKDEEITDAALTLPLGQAPEMIDALAAEMKSRGGQQASFETMQKALKTSHYDEPWRFTPEGKPITDELRVLSTPLGQYGQYTPDGGEKLYTFKIDDMLREIETEEFENMKG